MAGQRFLVPYVRVRLLPPQPFLAWSSSGLGRRPLKAEIGGSNPLQATMISKARSDERAFLLRLIGQKVCPKMDVDPGQRPFFIVKLKRNDFPARTKSVS